MMVVLFVVTATPIYQLSLHFLWDSKTRSHPEMVGDMSHVTLNFDQSKIPFVRF